MYQLIENYQYKTNSIREVLKRDRLTSLLDEGEEKYVRALYGIMFCLIDQISLEFYFFIENLITSKMRLLILMIIIFKREEFIER